MSGLILASASPRRRDLLQQIGIQPMGILPADIDESPQKAELPRDYAKRMAGEKLQKALHAFRAQPQNGAQDGATPFILAADTVVAVGRRILPKAETRDSVEACLTLLSGRAHRVYTGLALATPSGKIITRLVETRLAFKRLSKEELSAYLASSEGLGKAGGYAIQGLAASFVIKLIGSYSNVVGLPLYEVAQMLSGNGYPVSSGWAKDE